MTRARVAVVTGASDGIGRALSLELAREGYAVGLIARRVDRLATLQAAIEGDGGRAFAAAADVADREALLAAVRRIEDALGPTDLLVANAGISRPTDPLAPDARCLEEELAVNVVGVATAVEAVLPGMIERGGGHIVAVSSVAGWRGLPQAAGYCASKAALTTYMESCRIDWRDHGVTTTTVHPGFVDTPMIANADHPKPFQMSAEDAARRIARAIRTKRTRCDFPRPMVWIMRVVKHLPDAILARATRRPDRDA